SGYEALRRHVHRLHDDSPLALRRPDRCIRKGPEAGRRGAELYRSGQDGEIPGFDRDQERRPSRVELARPGRRWQMGRFHDSKLLAPIRLDPSLMLDEKALDDDDTRSVCGLHTNLGDSVYRGRSRSPIFAQARLAQRLLGYRRPQPPKGALPGKSPISCLLGCSLSRLTTPSKELYASCNSAVCGICSCWTDTISSAFSPIAISSGRSTRKNATAKSYSTSAGFSFC